MRTLPLNGMLTSLAINYNRRNKNVRSVRAGEHLPAEGSASDRASGGARTADSGHAMAVVISLP